MGDLIRLHAQSKSDAIAFRYLNNFGEEFESITFGELDRRLRSLAAYFQERKLANKRILIVFESGRSFIESFFGAIYAGAIPVPVCPPRRVDGIAKFQSIVNNCEPALAIAHEGVADTIPVPLEWHVLKDTPVNDSDANRWKPHSTNADAIAFLQYTSGSIAAPKGVCVSHRNICHNEKVIQEAFQHSEETIVVGWLPLYHDMGLIGNILQSIWLGVPCILMSPMTFLKKPFRWLNAISTFEASTSGGPDFAYDLCTDRITEEQLSTLNLKSWTVAYNGAEPIRSGTLQRFAETFAPAGFHKKAFLPCYGLAEMTLFATGISADQEPRILNADRQKFKHRLHYEEDSSSSDAIQFVGCGRPRQGDVVKIVAPDSLQICGEGEVGEIWMSGPSMTMGYWNDRESSTEAFQAKLPDDETSYLRTGDLGFLQKGELFITGRQKEVIIIRGINHHSRDLEESVRQSHPAFAGGRAAAFTVNTHRSQMLVMLQEVGRNWVRNSNLHEAATMAREAIAASHDIQLHDLVLVRKNALPITSSGKIRLLQCRVNYLEGQVEGKITW